MTRPKTFERMVAYTSIGRFVMTECKWNSKVLIELLDLLKLEKIEENIFYGNSQDLGFGKMFGGQVLGQSLSAACQTVNEEQRAHSLHGYFLRSGDPQKPIIYYVECIRDGKSFTTRQVKAIQNDRAIFTMSASFHVDEPGFDHQAQMPDIRGPEGILSQLENERNHRDKIHPSIREILTCDRPIEIRPVDPVNPFAPEKREPRQYTWFKAIDTIPDDISVHQYMLVYASDYSFLDAALYPHGHTFWDPEILVASLDHAMWFHRDFRMDQWLLYAMESPSACKARGLICGNIFTQDGQLVASTVQEALIRYRGEGAG